MIKNMKSNNGITLITLSVMVAIMMILTFTLSINANKFIELRRYKNFENDIQKLSEEISIYYSKNKELPIANKYINTTVIEKFEENSNNNENFYLIDLDKLDNINLNYGKEFNELENKTLDNAEIGDFFVINEQSQIIYYPKGISFNNRIVYTTQSTSSTSIEGVKGESISFDEVKYIEVDEEIDLKAEVYPTFTENKTIIWEVDNSNIATIDESGKLTGVAEGTVKVTAKLEDDHNVKKEITIKVYTLVIKTPEDLLEFSQKVNGGDAFLSKTIILANDIDMSSICHPADASNGAEKVNWTPIGIDSTVSFKGTFDGNNKIIDNIYINSINNYQALFGNITTNAIVKNVTVKGDITGCRWVAGIVGIARNGKISNCKNYANVNGNNPDNCDQVGGIVGTCYADVENCINYGNIKTITTNNNTQAGGIAGFLQEGKTIKNCENYGEVEGLITVGGIVGLVGYESPGTVQNCINYGNVKGTSSVGGIAGGLGTAQSTGDTAVRTIKECWNKGNVNAQTAGGGIVGTVSKNTRIYILDSANSGNITGSGEYIGGILGKISTTPVESIIIKNCYNAGNIQFENSQQYNYVAGIMPYAQSIVQIKNSYNIGSIPNTSISGALVAKNEGTINNSYYLEGSNNNLCGTNTGTIDASSSSKTRAQLIDDAMIETLNSNETENVWIQDVNNINNSYPILKWQFIWDYSKENKSSYANRPEISTGMTPIKFELPTDEQMGTIIETTVNDSNWYDYGTTYRTKKWANIKTEDGSMWVWIPRYAYKINSSNQTIDIVFLIGTSDYYLDDENNLQKAVRATASNSSPNTKGTQYVVHPAFTDETSITFKNGGWDEEISGIWIAKFEAGYASGNNQAQVKESSVYYELQSSNPRMCMG